MYLVDTDVLSRLRRPRSSGELPPWLVSRLASGLVISAATVVEIEQGARWVGQRHPHKEAEIRSWLFRLLAAYDTTVLPIGPEEALLWGRMRATPALRGFIEGTSTGPERPPKSEADLVIAATAIVTGRVLVTRNIAHMRKIDEYFRLPGLVDPWLYESETGEGRALQLVLDV